MNFSMEVPETDVIKKEVMEQTKPQPEEMGQLKVISDNNINEIINLDMCALADRENVVKTIENFGMDTIHDSARKNALTKVSVADLFRGDFGGGEVAQNLVALQREMKELDPSLIDFTKKGILGKLFNPIRDYFAKYQKADGVINDIIRSLEKGKATLKNDNTTLDIEEIELRKLTKKLAKEIEMGTMLDQGLSEALEQAKARGEDPDRIKFITEEVIFPLKQRLMDMQQMLVVNQQGILALEVIRRNNKELIRGVERACNVTVSALRIATMVAGALYNQKIVLQKVQLINETTDQMISGTAKMLKEQGAQIHRQSMETNLSVETLKQAFTDTMEAFDAISQYKQEALPKMQETILAFKEMADAGEKQIQKLEEGI